MAKAPLAHPLLVGAVLHDCRSLAVWESLKAHCATRGCQIDYVFFSNYKAQVDALVDGHIDIAWNSCLAWLDTARRTEGGCQALAMRDRDRDRSCHLIVRKADGFSAVDALRGKTVATGSEDSPHTTLLPLHFLHGFGLKTPADVTVRHVGAPTGLHGDRADDERRALRALEAGECDAAAVLDLHWNAWQADGTADPDRLTVLASTPPCDRANFTVLNGFPTRAALQWTEALFSLRDEHPEYRASITLEGMDRWVAGRTSGYAMLSVAVREARFFEPLGGGRRDDQR